MDVVGNRIHLNGQPFRLVGGNLEGFAGFYRGTEPAMTPEDRALVLEQIAELRGEMGANFVRLVCSPGDYRYWDADDRYWPHILGIADECRDFGMILELVWWNVAAPGGEAEPFPWGPAAIKPVWDGDLVLHRRWLIEAAQKLGDRGDVLIGLWDEPIKAAPVHRWPELRPVVQSWVDLFRSSGGRNVLGISGNHFGRDIAGITGAYPITDPLDQWFVDYHEFAGMEEENLDLFITTDGVPIDMVRPLVLGGCGWTPTDGPCPPAYAAFLAKLWSRLSGIAWWAWHEKSTPNLLEAGGYPQQGLVTLTAYGQYAATHPLPGRVWSNGWEPPVTSPVHSVILTAAADPYGTADDPGPWPLVQLRIATKLVGAAKAIDVDKRTGAWGVFVWPLEAAPKLDDQLAVEFINDAASATEWTKPGNDRNLHIHSLTIKGPVTSITLLPETAKFVGVDGAVRNPAGPIVYRNGAVIWNGSSPPPPPPPPLPPSPPPPAPAGDFVAMFARVDRPRLDMLDPITVPWAQKPKFLREIVVDINRGNDGSVGDEARPLRTLDAGQRRARELGAGTRVMVRGGDYDFGGGRFDWLLDGRPDGWFGLFAWPGERPRLRSAGWGAFRTYGSYLVIEGFDVDGSRKGYKSPWTGKIMEEDEQFEEECRARLGDKTHHPSGWDVGDGISIWGGQAGENGRGLHHVIVHDCISHRWPGSGLNSSGMDYLLVRNCLSAGNCHFMGWGGSGYSIFGARNMGSFGSEMHRIIVEQCVARSNIQYKNTYGRDNISDGGGFQNDVCTSQFAYRLRMLMRSNLSFDNGLSGMHCTSSGFVDFVGNTCWANNQHPQNRGKPEMWVGWDSPDCSFLGNVLVSGHGAVPLARVQLNGTVRASRNNVLSAKTDFMGQGDLVGDPRFILASKDPAVANFGIGPDSPAIGHGDPLAFCDLFGRTKATPDAGAIWRTS